MHIILQLKLLVTINILITSLCSFPPTELLLKTLDHYCEYRKTPNGIVLTPTPLGKWLIMFCDEINLPDMDKYGTQVSFLD